MSEKTARFLLGGIGGGLLGLPIAFGIAILMRLLGVWPFVFRGGGANIGAGMFFMALLILCPILCGSVGAVLAAKGRDEDKEKTGKPLRAKAKKKAHWSDRKR